MKTAEKHHVLVLGGGTAGKVWPGQWATKEGELPSSTASVSEDPVPILHAY